MIIEGEYTYARFLDRPNRFLAKIKLYSNEKVEYSHVPDPGRLKELLLPGVEVFVRKETRMNRKTKYSLIGVKAENGTWVNIDSQVSNKLFQSEMSKIKDFQNYKILKSEFSLGNSRIDFLLENLKDNKQALVEVKSVTLVEENIAFFPDAPTKRGVKHLRELEKAVQEKKYAAFIVFIVKRSDAKSFSPNWKRDRNFANELVESLKGGVKIIAVRCAFSPEKKELRIMNKIPYVLNSS